MAEGQKPLIEQKDFVRAGKVMLIGEEGRVIGGNTMIANNAGGNRLCPSLEGGV